MFRKRRQNPTPTALTSAGAGGASFDIVFVGDTSLGDWYLRRSDPHQLERLRAEPMSFFQEVTPLLAGAQLRIANLETVLQDSPTSPLEGIKNYLGWDSPERTVEVLKQLQFDAVSLANNHTMDFGPTVLKSTISELTRAGIGYFGAGTGLAAASAPQSWVARTAGLPEKRVYLIGALRYTAALRRYDFFATQADGPGVNPLSARAAMAQLAKLRSEDPDGLIVLFPHWGDNYKWASENMRARSRQFLAAGADLVIGHGAHMMQEIVTYPEGTTVFSIGNFVFNSRGRYDAMQAHPYSCVARLSLRHDGGGWGAALKLYPIISDNTKTGYTPRPVDADGASDLFEALRARSPVASSFEDTFRLGQDSLGWHISLQAPLSPRLNAPEATSRNGTRATGHGSVTGLSVGFDAAPSGPASNRPRRVAHDPDRYGEGSSQACYARALQKRGISYDEGEVTIRNLTRPAIRFEIHGTPYLISAARIYIGDGSWTVRRRPDIRAAAIVRRKDVTSSILRASGYSAPEGSVFGGGQRRHAQLYFEALQSRYHNGFCVKPPNGGLGKHVYVGVQRRDNFLRAFDAVAGDYDQVLVEETLAGTVHRFIWVGGRVSAVRVGLPMNVVGDGVSRISDLVEHKNKQRSSNVTLRSNPLRITGAELDFLKRTGYTPETVPAAGETVVLSDRSNRHAGADLIDTTDRVHPSYKECIGKAVATIPDMLVCGADVILQDPDAPAAAGNYSVLELNCGPGIAGHHHPSVGEGRDVAGDVIDHLLSMRTEEPGGG